MAKKVYVASYGNDTNTGLNENNPLSTIDKAFEYCDTGDTVFILDNVTIENTKPFINGSLARAGIAVPVILPHIIFDGYPNKSGITVKYDANSHSMTLFTHFNIGSGIIDCYNLIFKISSTYKYANGQYAPVIAASSRIINLTNCVVSFNPEKTDSYSFGGLTYTGVTKITCNNCTFLKLQNGVYDDVNNASFNNKIVMNKCINTISINKGNYGFNVTNANEIIENCILDEKYISDKNNLTHGVYSGTNAWEVTSKGFYLKSNSEYYSVNTNNTFYKVDTFTEDNKITDLSVINKNSITTLVAPVELVQINIDEGIEHTEIFNTAINILSDNEYIKANGDIDIQQVESIYSMSIDYTVVNNGFIRLAISIDSGVTWLTFKDSEFIPLNNLTDDLKLNGIDPINLNSIEQIQWDTIVKANKFRLAYGIYQIDTTDNVILKSVSITLKYEGIWKSIQLGVDYNYNKGNDFIEVTYLKAGSYLVNYVE